MITEKNIAEIVEPLLNWFQRNARDLPWRKDSDPYHVWISEIMLQQTRVEFVKEYYVRFLEELPTVKALAEVPDDRLLKLWQGLGYYQRAKNLKKAAGKIMSDFHGAFPDSPETLRGLSGIGEYTAGAVSSIAFGLPEPAVDGNVLRVLSRLLASRADISLPDVRRRFSELLRGVYPNGKCSAFTQSLMELGALVCLPNGVPKCGVCPLAELCRANNEKLTETIPVKTSARPRTVEDRTVFLLVCGGEIALKKRPSRGLLAGLWEFPSEEGFLSMEDIRARYPESKIVPAVKYRHIFSHKEWNMKSFRIELNTKKESFSWFSMEELKDRAALPSAFRPFLEYWSGENKHERS